MVNNLHVWKLKGLTPPPVLTDSNREIQGGPIYHLVEVKKAISEYGFFVINEDAREDIVNDFLPPLDGNEILNIFKALKSDHYKNSMWVKTSVNTILGADAYIIKWNRNKNCEYEFGHKLYIKFGFRENIGKCLVVSFHISDY